MARACDCFKVNYSGPDVTVTCIGGGGAGSGGGKSTYGHGGGASGTPGRIVHAHSPRQQGNLAGLNVVIDAHVKHGVAWIVGNELRASDRVMLDFESRNFFNVFDKLEHRLMANKDSKKASHCKIDVVENGWIVTMTQRCEYDGDSQQRHVFNDFTEMSKFIKATLPLPQAEPESK